MIFSWQPVLEDLDRERALEITREIAIVIGNYSQSQSCGLMGITGIALFLAYAEHAGLANDLGAHEWLERGVEGLASGSTNLGLWTGAAGVRWAISHLIAGHEQSELLSYIDDGIYARLQVSPYEDLDLYQGLAGLLLAYADDVDRRDGLLERVLDRLEVRDFSKLGRHELGCAHGIAGMLCGLARCYESERSNHRAEAMILRLANTLTEIHVVGQQIGWCRGDNGIAISLLNAARALNRRDLETRAIQMACASFICKHVQLPVDASLCHGAAGIGHLCNRMYQATGNDQLRTYARTWLRNTMAMRRQGEGVAGFMMFRGKPRPTWVADPSLLVGAAGVGLALIAGATSIVPSWDRTLGVDIQCNQMQSIA